MAIHDKSRSTISNHRSPIFWLTWDLLVPLAIALGLSLWVAGGDRELGWQRAFAGADFDWPIGDHPLWQFLYHFGPVPAEIVAIAGILGLVAGFRVVKLRQWRRVFWFLILLLVIAPGLITNLILKEHWGRPRPREVIDFGGRYAFEALFSLDPAGDGKSFPCGHATMGFFFVAGYFLLRKSRFGLSLGILGGGLGLGGLMGYTRMLQGGHFASDVVWAGAITFLTAAGLFHALGLNRRLLDEPKPATESSRIPLKVKMAGGAAIAILVAGLAFAMPYHDKRDFSLLHPDAATMPLKPSLKIAMGDVEIVSGKSLTVTGEAWGHGVPTSQIASRWEEEVDGDVLRPKLIQRFSGYLTEIRQNLHVTIPWDRTVSAKFDLGPGQVRLQLPMPDESKRIELRIEETELLIELLPGAKLEIASDSLDLGAVSGAWKSSDSGPRYVLKFTKRDGGTVTIRENPAE